MLRARRLRRPEPVGSGTTTHEDFDPILAAVASGGIPAIDGPAVTAYAARLASLDPDTLTRPAALAYWINLYNALALDLAARAAAAGAAGVFGVPGAFDRPVITVAGERLSLDGIEHGKVRRFGDPRIHAALVCGSLSCPTLRGRAYTEDIEPQLDQQMRSFLEAGGITIDRTAGTVELSRIFLWYGADFVRPHRIPAVLPARKRDIARAAAAWLPDGDRSWVEAERPRVTYLAYDWSLGCAVRPVA